MTRLFVIYDERAMIDVDDAMVLCTARSLKEAKRDIRQMWPDQGAVVYSYDQQGKELVDEQFEYYDRMKSPNSAQETPR